MVMSFCAVFFPRGVLDEILNLTESVSEDFPSYSYRTLKYIVSRIVNNLFNKILIANTRSVFAYCISFGFI